MERKQESNLAAEVVAAMEPAPDTTSDESVDEPSAIDVAALATTEAKREPGVAVGAVDAEPGIGECPPELTIEHWTSTQRALALMLGASLPEGLHPEAQLATSARVEAFLAAVTKATPATPLIEPNPQVPNANVPALAALEGKMSDFPDLLEYQLNMSVQTGFSPAMQSKLRRGALDLYVSLAPKDAVESMVARLIVGLNNATMLCFERFGRSTTERSQGVNMGYGVKGAARLVQTVKFYEARRNQKTVTLRNVNPKSGGKAIVRNTEVGDRGMPKRPQAGPRLGIKRSGGK